MSKQDERAQKAAQWLEHLQGTVDDAGCVQVDASYYAASPAPLYSEVTVRIFEREVEILGEDGQVLRRHDKAARRGEYVLPEADRIFNPSRQTAQLIGRVSKIGPYSAQLAREIFARLGRPGEKAIYGMANLPAQFASIRCLRRSSTVHVAKPPSRGFQIPGDCLASQTPSD